MINRRTFLGGIVGFGAPLIGGRVLANQRTPRDDSDVLRQMLSSPGVVDLPGGIYFVGSDLFVPPPTTVRFAVGAKIVIGPNASVVWDGGIEAGPRQHIFDGALLRGPYQRIGDMPYTFALSGRPRIEWASPFWFGARGDGQVDDAPPLYCAQYFGGRQYLPSGQYSVSQSIHLRQNSQLIYGDGPTSMIKASRPNLGQVIAIRGVPPTRADAEPQTYLVDVTVRDLSVDGADAVNNNGIGASFCQHCTIRNILMQNIGRKAVTLQYWCKTNIIEDIKVIDALQEPDGKTAAISIEGQRGGLNFSLDGGVSHTADMEGWDCVDNRMSSITILQTSFRYIVLTRARNNVFSNVILGETPGTRSDIFFGPFAEGNVLRAVHRSGQVSVCRPLNSNRIGASARSRVALIQC
jgi:hypothetical protein|nr:hypothetical protein [Neorhizobium tomejilense]